MRWRVLLPLLALGLLAVIAVVVPVCEAIAVSRTQQLTLQRTSTMDQIVQRAATVLAGGPREPLEQYLERVEQTYGEAAVVVDAGGEVLVASGGLEVPAGDPQSEAAADLRAALRALPQWSIPTVRPWSEPTAFAAEPVTGRGGVASGGVLLQVSLEAARADVARSWAIVVLIGLALLAALLAASLRWTSWVLRPVHALDEAATAIAQQRRPAETELSGPPELRQLSATFAHMARTVESTFDQQRAFVADASHQLRNPLAAIRLRVDAAPVPAGEEEWREPVDRDLDRLERMVERMLVLADAEHRATADTALGEAPPLLRVTACELAESAASAAGSLRVDADEGPAVAVRGRRADLEEIVELAVDNARKYAGEGARVRIGLHARGETAVLEVADDGPGLPDAELAQAGTRFWRSAAHQGLPGTGLGIAIMQERARANGGSLRIERAETGGLLVVVELRGS